MKKLSLSVIAALLTIFSTVASAEDFELKFSNKGLSPGNYALGENTIQACARAYLRPDGQTSPAHGSTRKHLVTDAVNNQTICFHYPGKRAVALSRTDLRRNKDKYFDISTYSFRIEP